MSGDFTEVRFHATGTCAWVKFMPPDSEPWIAVFGSGDFGYEAVSVLESRPTAFVIAGGTPYIIDYEAQQLLWRDPEVCLTGIVAIESKSMFIAHDEIRMRAYSADGKELWATRRVSWDGIRNVLGVGETVQGEAADLGGAYVPFSVDITTGSVYGGSYEGADPSAD